MVNLHPNARGRSHVKTPNMPRRRKVTHVVPGNRRLNCFHWFSMTNKHSTTTIYCLSVIKCGLKKKKVLWDKGLITASCFGEDVWHMLLVQMHYINVFFFFTLQVNARWYTDTASNGAPFTTQNHSLLTSYANCIHNHRAISSIS